MKNKVNKKYIKLESPRSTHHLDLRRAISAPAMPHLKPSVVTVNLRMPVVMVNALKTQANKQDVPYQSYMKMLLARALNLKMA